MNFSKMTHFGKSQRKERFELLKMFSRHFANQLLSEILRLTKDGKLNKRIKIVMRKKIVARQCYGKGMNL